MLFELIVTQNVRFPSRLSNEAMSLLSGLLEKVPLKRWVNSRTFQSHGWGWKLSKLKIWSFVGCFYCSKRIQTTIPFIQLKIGESWICVFEWSFHVLDILSNWPSLFWENVNGSANRALWSALIYFRFLSSLPPLLSLSPISGCRPEVKCDTQYSCSAIIIFSLLKQFCLLPAWLMSWFLVVQGG